MSIIKELKESMPNKENLLIEVFLPKLGESITTATVVKWLKKEGDFVRLDEPLLEVSTDKVNSEIPAPIEGILKTICVSADEEKEVGHLLCLIETKKNGKEGSDSPIKTASLTQSGEGDLFLSPAVLRLMQEFQLSKELVESIEGTGKEGRRTKKDLEAYLRGEKKIRETSSCIKKIESVEPKERIEKKRMTPIRKAIAENMSRSFYTAPHASLVIEVDMTPLSQWIDREKTAIYKEHQVKVTYTPFIAEAICRAIEKYPLINSSLDQETILLKKQVNLGIAVSLEEAVLVPVIKQAESLSWLELAQAIQSVAYQAKTGILKAESVQNGTITLTNFGMGGALIGMPIIRYPEAAIIGVGAVTKKVVVLENDAMAIRKMAYLSLTFDHRILDGMYASLFLSEIKTILESHV